MINTKYSTCDKYNFLLFSLFPTAKLHLFFEKSKFFEHYLLFFFIFVYFGRIMPLLSYLLPPRGIISPLRLTANMAFATIGASKE